MEEGTVRALPFSGPINIFWGPRSRGSISTHGQRIGFGITKVDFKSFRCPKCKIVIFSYEKEEEETTDRSGLSE
jgi:hypothetical protein